MALEREGIRFERVPCDALGCPDEDALLRALNRPEVRLLTVSWVSFASGYRVDLAALGRACRSRGIWFVVDGIQGVGALPIDLHALDVDILACGGQKWLLSPWGSGFVYVRESLVRQLAPSAVGWLAVRGGDDYSRLVDYDLTWRDDARRFEVITLPYQDMLGLATSVELLLEVGTERIGAHVQSLVDEAVRWAQRRRDVRLITPADRARRAGVVSIAPPDPVAVSARLNAAGVSHSLREGAIRLSPHCYNTSEEMERSLELMR
jgi:selenocysteine lyase/cysteine desulfurase